MKYKCIIPFFWLVPSLWLHYGTMFLFSVCLRAFSSTIVKILAFTISKHYFYNFNISFYNIPNIKHSIFFTTSFKYSFFNIFIHWFLSPLLVTLSSSDHPHSQPTIHHLHKPTTNHHPQNPNNNPPQSPKWPTPTQPQPTPTPIWSNAATLTNNNDHH